jgi:hypothetical protein
LLDAARVELPQPAATASTNAMGAMTHHMYMLLS